MKSINFQTFKRIRGEQCLLNSSALAIHTQNDKLGYRKLNKSIISFSNTQISEEVKFYEWRRKTEFPIVKIVNFEVKMTYSNKTLIEVQMQDHPLKLNEIKSLPFFKILYLLKEAIIGFERLYNMFGPFAVTSKMIAINSRHKCEVWLNQNFASNCFKREEIDEQSFLSSILSVIESASLMTKNAHLFFQKAKYCSTFSGVLSLIEIYAVENKISVSTTCKIHSNQTILSSFKNNKSIEKTKLQTSSKISMRSFRTSVSTRCLNPLSKTTVKKYSYRDTNDKMTLKDTASEFNSKTNSSLKRDSEEYFTNNPFSSEGVDIVKSYLPLKMHQKKKSTRKFSEQYNQKLFFTPKEKSNDTAESQMGCPTLKYTFGTNNWQKTFNQFLSCEQLKISIHQGKSQRKDEIKLPLLANYGKSIDQSLISEQGEINQY